MKLVMHMLHKPFKTSEVIFDFGEKSDDLYLIHPCSVEIVLREGLVLATFKVGQLFGKMARSFASMNAPRGQSRPPTR